jgi:MFS family permease
VRTLGQVFGAATGSASMALIFSSFQRDDRVKAMGWWSLVGAGGPVIGVVAGGPIIESVGWRWVFWGQVPLIAVAGVVGVLVLPAGGRVHRERPRFDVAGTVALTVAVTALLLGLNRGGAWGWGSPKVLGALAIVPLAVVAFVGAERRAVEPLLPLAWLRRRNFTLGVAAQATGNFAYMGGFILAPRLMDQVFHFGESKVGLVSIARPLTFSLVAPLAGYLAVVVGERASAVAGSVAIVASMLCFSALTGSSPLLAIIGCLAPSGLGMGVSSPSLAASIANVVDESSMGVASAVQQLMSQVGLVAGIQLLSTVQSSHQAAGLVGSFSLAYRLGAVAAVLAVACSAFVVRAPRRRVALPATDDPAPAVASRA